MLHSQDRCVHNVWVTSQTLSPHSVTPPLHHGHQLLFKHTHKHKLTQIHTHTNTPHILQIFLPSNSEAALLSKVPGLQSYRGKSLSSILNIFKKKCNEARRGMSSSFLRSRRLQRNTCDNNPFTYVGKEEGTSGEGC